jgi:hypothetical protein
VQIFRAYMVAEMPDASARICAGCGEKLRAGPIGH